MEHFAAQCGFCTSGMLMAAKALLDRNPSPTREDVVEAISGNICRCTGYEPIINAILDAASKRGGQAEQRAGPCSSSGKSTSRTSATTVSTRSASRRQRQDMLGHVTGRSRYFDDHAFEGLLHLKVLRSPHPHARLRAIDVSAAERSPGVKRVIRAADVPVNKNTLLSLINFGKDDEPLLAVDKVRYKGEPIVAVVAESEAAAYDALAKIRVDYDPLPAVFDVEEAIKPGAPVVNETYPANTFEYHEKYNHQKLRFGDVERAFAVGRLHGRRALPDVAHRARADRDQRLHRRARDQRPLRGAHLHAGAVLLARHRRQAARRALQPPALHRRHGRRRLRRQGRFAHRAARPFSAPC